ncbi:hypothetical protein [Larkinella rosea]|uniref:Response regulator n=1 Tax=Larkinella rosea TaxID=2025312 RepID=A0A3P1BV36_9BACT|nr:hypothetical protein [Larkinella rosea]RRB04937.1 hypothetical protein EHT25_15885 [Larkinella rosea]
MSLPEKTVTGYVAMVAPLTDDYPPVVPGLESQYASHPMLFYQSASDLYEKLCDLPTLGLPTLIVMDFSQSIDLGLGILRELKANERLRPIPVLIRKQKPVSSIQRATTALLNHSTTVFPEVVKRAEKSVAVGYHSASPF